MPNFILASKSPRRRELIKRIGITDFTIIEADIDETVPENIRPWQAVCYLALGKARAVAKKCGPDDVIIAADTLVTIGGDVLGKPHTHDEAYNMISRLSGNWHEVMTGVVVRRGDIELVEYEATGVHFRDVEPSEIENYIATGEPFDKAGGYGIQDYASLFVERTEGDYFNAMGLPLFRLGQMLREVGVRLL